MLPHTSLVLEIMIQSEQTLSETRHRHAWHAPAPSRPRKEARPPAPTWWRGMLARLVGEFRGSEPGLPPTSA